MSGYYGPLETWKIVYLPKSASGGIRGVAFVEADCKQRWHGIMLRQNSC